MKIDFPVRVPWSLSKQRRPMIQGFVWAVIDALPEGTSRPDISSAVCAALANFPGTFTRNGKTKAPAFLDPNDRGSHKTVTADWLDSDGSLDIRFHY